MLTGIPLLHYFQCGNEYSGAHFGMRYHFKPGKKAAPQPDGTEKEEPTLFGVIWPDPWAEEKTDPALLRHKDFPLSDEGRAQAAQWLAETFAAEEENWKTRPGILDCEPWHPAPDAENAEKAKP
ncbi:MAG: histidine phosphatase family protein [Faecalibacterium sp.]|jgi:hypothetical protein|nr:histidine phosphatase family protein [Faecalibacterium sp.]